MVFSRTVLAMVSLCNRVSLTVLGWTERIPIRIILLSSRPFLTFMAGIDEAAFISLASLLFFASTRAAYGN